MSEKIGCQCYAPIPLGRTCVACNRPIGWEAKGKSVASYVVRSALAAQRERTTDQQEADDG